jgi:AcrR family transcriptional regulator
LIEEELTPRERRYQRTQQAILTAARNIIAEGGADKLSMRAIADRIDYSPAGLYEYFGSKEEIILAVSWEGHRTLKRYLEKIDLALAPDQYLVELGLAYINFALQNPDYFMLIFTSSATQSNYDGDNPAVPSKAMMAEDSSFPILVAGVERAAKTGTIRMLEGLGAFETAYTFWAVVHGAAMLRITHLQQIKADFDSANRQMLAAYVRGMKT